MDKQVRLQATGVRYQVSGYQQAIFHDVGRFEKALDERVKVGRRTRTGSRLERDPVLWWVVDLVPSRVYRQILMPET
jgi:hypothetical protein